MSQPCVVCLENCPACFEVPKERHRVKQLLAHQELLFPRLYQVCFKPILIPESYVSYVAFKAQFDLLVYQYF